MFAGKEEKLGNISKFDWKYFVNDPTRIWFSTKKYYNSFT